VVEDDDPRPGPGEVRVRVLAVGVSFTDAQLRAGTYLGVPKPPFTPGYELVGAVEELGPGCERLRVGDRLGALTVWSADAERVCSPEADTSGEGVAESPRLVVRFRETDDFCRMLTGRLNLPLALVGGKLKLRGDLRLFLHTNRLFSLDARP
jgi:Zn-dependent alcohol dehydrogenase